METRILFQTALLIVSLTSFSCNQDTIQAKECPNFTIEEGTISNTEEYLIIDAVIKNNFNQHAIVHLLNNTEQVVIGGDLEDTQEYLIGNEVELEIDFIEAYLNINAVTSKWNPLFEKANLISKEERNCFFTNNDFPCESYENKYPGGSGFLSFTRPAVFDNNTAIVEYIHESCNGIRGVFLMLELQNGTWEVTTFFTTIIS